jgi:hypothetical protein
VASRENIPVHRRRAPPSDQVLDDPVLVLLDPVSLGRAVLAESGLSSPLPAHPRAILARTTVWQLLGLMSMCSLTTPTAIFPLRRSSFVFIALCQTNPLFTRQKQLQQKPTPLALLLSYLARRNEFRTPEKLQ